MNALKNHLKICAVCVLRLFLRVLWVFPVKKTRVFFIAWNGTQYSCNPKYIFEYMYREGDGRYEFVWCVNDKTMIPGEFINVKTVRFRSFSYIYYVLTSRFYFGNAGVSPYLPFRKGQAIVNTWHGGGAYKKVGVINIGRADNLYTKFVLELTGKETTAFISTCEKFTNVMSESYCIDRQKFLSIGMPRNDLLFQKRGDVIQKVRDRLPVHGEDALVLYAPTYRGEPREGNAESVASLDVPAMVDALSRRFEKRFVCLFRRHSFFIYHSEAAGAGVIDVSSYPDMQELLCAADVLVTDYSSSMWDFSLTYKPCFLYTPDVGIYTNERDFYTPIDQWPFPRAETNEAFAKVISTFDQTRYLEKVKKHHAALGSYETGHACEKIYEMMRG